MQVAALFRCVVAGRAPFGRSPETAAPDATCPALCLCFCKGIGGCIPETEAHGPAFADENFTNIAHIGGCADCYYATVTIFCAGLAGEAGLPQNRFQNLPRLYAARPILAIAIQTALAVFGRVHSIKPDVLLADAETVTINHAQYLPVRRDDIGIAEAVLDPDSPARLTPPAPQARLFHP